MRHARVGGVTGGGVKLGGGDLGAAGRPPPPSGGAVAAGRTPSSVKDGGEDARGCGTGWASAAATVVGRGEDAGVDAGAAPSTGGSATAASSKRLATSGGVDAPDEQ